MPERLPVDLDDGRREVAIEQHHDFADAPSCHRWVAAPEQSSLDQLVAIEQRDLARPSALDVLAHLLGVVGMQEHETRLARGRVAQQYPELFVADDVEHLVGIRRGVSVVGREKDERVAGDTTRERKPQREVEDGGLDGGLLTAWTVQVRDGVDAGPVRIDIRRPRRIRERRAQADTHRRWEDSRRVDELRSIAPPRALAQLSEERRDTLVA